MFAHESHVANPITKKQDYWKKLKRFYKITDISIFLLQP